MATRDENVKSISMRQWNTGLGTHSSRCTNKRQKRRDVTRMGYYRLRRNQHPYIKTPRLLKATRDVTSGGRHHYPRDERRSDATCKGHRKTRITVQYLDYLAPVHKSVVPVMPMRAYNLVRDLPWFHKQTWHRLDSIDTLQSPNASGAEEWHRWLRQWHRRFQKPKMITSRQAAGARSGYTDTWSNRIRRSSN